MADDVGVASTSNRSEADSETGTGGPPDPIELAGLDEPRGVRTHDAARAANGYVLFSPMISGFTYLIDRQGQVVQQWQSEYASGSEYLLADGSLLRGGRVPDAPRFNGGGQGGRIEKFTWQGDLLWAFELADRDYLLHHDFEPLPNGNILSLAWEAITPEAALARGRRADNIPRAGLWPDLLVEIAPTADGGRVVWQWRAWDHLVQDTDPALPNYGAPADYPHRIDVNAGQSPEQISAEDLALAKARNEIPGSATVDDRGSDFQHSNAVAYNAELDQIAISVRALSEIWIVDHSVSTEQAAGPAGDLLYRWGNPETYGRARQGDVGLGHQHDVRWIAEGLPGAGHLMVFSNEMQGAPTPRSQVVEFAPEMADGRYLLREAEPFGPAELVWSYSEERGFAPFISGANRTPEGNTLINYGPQGRFVEVTASGDTVWEYWSPYSGDVRMPDGSWPQPGAPFFYSVFRASFVPSDHPALTDRDLEPLVPQPAPSVLPEEELAPHRLPTD